MKAVPAVLGALAGALALAIGLAALYPKQFAVISLSLEHARLGLSAKTVQVSGIDIAYLEGGAGEPLVLVHGFTADKDHFARVSGPLRSRFHVYAIDLPGFGDSGKPADWRYRIQDQVEYLHSILQALGIRQVHLGGNSMGGDIVASYAARHPNEVASLWLLAPYGVATAPPSEMFQHIAAMKPGDRMPLLTRTPEDFPEVFGLMFYRAPFDLYPMMPYLAERAAANYKLHERIYQEIRAESIPLENLMGGSQIPTRIVWGANDRVLNPAGAQILSALMPRSSVWIMPETGHLPMVEHPRAVAEDYLKFRDSIR